MRIMGAPYYVGIEMLSVENVGLEYGTIHQIRMVNDALLY